MYPKIVVKQNYFPTQWCNNINSWMINNVEPNPKFGSRGVRRCTVRMLGDNLKPYDGVFRSLIDFVKPNLKLFNVDLDFKIDGAIQHITYNVGDHVGWHDDLMDVQTALGNPDYKDLKTNRKLSITVMLSDPSDFTGGEFIFDSKIHSVPRVFEKGTVALFTSHTRHKVEEITSGVRNILFAFLTGPEWR